MKKQLSCLLVIVAFKCSIFLYQCLRPFKTRNPSSEFHFGENYRSLGNEIRNQKKLHVTLCKIAKRKVIMDYSNTRTRFVIIKLFQIYKTISLRFSHFNYIFGNIIK